MQVDLEIQGGSTHAARLERALQQARFEPDSARIWRWHEETAQGMVVKIEFLADLDDVPNQEVVRFDDTVRLAGSFRTRPRVGAYLAASLPQRGSASANAQLSGHKHQSWPTDGRTITIRSGS